MSWLLLADLVVIIHAGYVAFVLVGFAAIITGAIVGARWSRNFGFRLAHLMAIALVCLEQLVGVECPLTSIENALRLGAGERPYPADFIGYWLDRLIFYNAPASIFALLYFGGAALVVISWWLWPPRRPTIAGDSHQSAGRRFTRAAFLLSDRDGRAATGSRPADRHNPKGTG